MMQAESSFLPERMSRFVAGWLLASIVPALPLIVIESQTVLLLGSSANERRAGLLAFSGIVLFLLLSAVGNWLFMRHRGVQPIAWGAMTIIGAAFGLVAAGVVGVLGPPLMSKWYFVTADDLIDKPAAARSDDRIARRRGRGHRLWIRAQPIPSNCTAILDVAAPLLVGRFDPGRDVRIRCGVSAGPRI
jgi:hypothetical protein